MVNLLGRRGPRRALAWVDGEPGGRLEARIASLARLASSAGLVSVAAALGALEADHEELDAAPTRLAALALLEAIDASRRESVLRHATEALGVDASARLAGGEYVCHRPGTSLATGEAEIASRGFFDVWDRPPSAHWIGLLTAPASTRGMGEELWIVAWVAPAQIEAARAGCRACPSGALVPLASLEPEAEATLRALAARVGAALERAAANALSEGAHGL